MFDVKEGDYIVTTLYHNRVGISVYKDIDTLDNNQIILFQVTNTRNINLQVAETLEDVLTSHMYFRLNRDIDRITDLSLHDLAFLAETYDLDYYHLFQSVANEFEGSGPISYSIKDLGNREYLLVEEDVNRM